MNNRKIYFSLISLLLLITACRNIITNPYNDQIEEKPSVVVSLKSIVYPSERVEWQQGEIHEIKWQVTPNLDSVKIVLLKKFEEVETIVNSTVNNGHFNWFIPSDLPGSHHYRIRIISPKINSVYTTSVEFEILPRGNPIIE